MLSPWAALASSQICQRRLVPSVEECLRRTRLSHTQLRVAPVVNFNSSVRSSNFHFNPCSLR